jgi:hypothetical protein
MSDADDAYAEAVRQIGEAKRDRVTELSLTIVSLQNLPSEIAELEDLRALKIGANHLYDLSPLSGMKYLLELDLYRLKHGQPGRSALLLPPNLTKLCLGLTILDDLAPIAALSSLTTLDLTMIKLTGRNGFAVLREMTGLRSLNLQSVRSFHDASILAGLTNLTELNLSNTHTVDLSPLQNLRLLAERPTGVGLVIQGTYAHLFDPRIAEIARIEDNAERAQTLFEYLKDWVPPAEVVVEPDDLLPVILTNGKLEIARSLPSEAEIDDRLKWALHGRLLPKAEELARVAGNTQGRLAGRARSLVDRLDRPFEELDMINIHLDVEDLTTSLRTNADRVGEDRYSPDIVDALTDVASIGPGLTLDNVDVEKLEDRKRRFAADPPGAEVMAAHSAFSRAVAADMYSMGDNLRALEARLVDREGEASSGVLQVSVHRDMFIRIGRYALVDGKTIVLGALGSGLFAFVYENWSVILPLAKSYGTGFAQWFTAMIAQVSDFAGLAAHVEVKPILRKREPK